MGLARAGGAVAGRTSNAPGADYRSAEMCAAREEIGECLNAMSAVTFSIADGQKLLPPEHVSEYLSAARDEHEKNQPQGCMYQARQHWIVLLLIIVFIKPVQLGLGAILWLLRYCCPRPTERGSLVGEETGVPKYNSTD